VLESSGSAIALLALLYVFQGVRHLAPGTIVLAHSPFSGWQLVEPFALGRGFHVVGWFIPLTLPLVLAPRDGVVDDGRGAKARVDDLGAELMILRPAGIASALLLALGLPLATARSGLWGFLAAFIVLLTLCLFQGVVEAVVRRRLGSSWPEVIGIVVASLWPFTAPLAAERVLAQQMVAVPRAAIVRGLVSDAAFADAYRRELYDEAHGRVPDVPADLRPALRSHLATAVPRAALPGLHCPRCGAGFVGDVKACTDCEDVPLENSGPGTLVG
jgi:hypothetical protein